MTTKLASAEYMIRLSISVVCYNSSSKHLQSLIDSLKISIKYLRQHYELPTIPVFIIDNSDNLNVLAELCSLENQRLEEVEVELHRIAGHGNIGYGRAHNLALQVIDSDYHLILNPDVTLEEDALFLALALMTQNEEIKALSPNATDRYGNKQHLCKSYPSVFTLLIRGLGLSAFEKLFSERLSFYENQALPEDKPTEKEMLLGGCFMLVETQALKVVNGFDERYFLYFEDFDLSIRIGQLGKLVYAPEVRITHLGGNTSTKGLWHVQRFLISGIRFFNTHGWSFF